MNTVGVLEHSLALGPTSPSLIDATLSTTSTFGDDATVSCPSPRVVTISIGQRGLWIEDGME